MKSIAIIYLLIFSSLITNLNSGTFSYELRSDGGEQKYTQYYTFKVYGEYLNNNHFKIVFLNEKHGDKVNDIKIKIYSSDEKAQFNLKFESLSALIYSTEILLEPNLLPNYKVEVSGVLTRDKQKLYLLDKIILSDLKALPKIIHERINQGTEHH